jgi:hypothetical protein
MSTLPSFLNGATAMACAIAGVLFMTYWRDTRDRLFVFFAAAFWVLALQWTMLAAVDPADEHRHLFYLPRLVAFAFIAAGIADKNREVDEVDPR